MSQDNQSVKNEKEYEPDTDQTQAEDEEADELVEVSREELDELQQEAEEFREKYYRRAADLDNLRKRFKREKEKYLKYANEDLLSDLLEVLDNFERALNSMEFDNEEVQRGVEMIYDQLNVLIENYDVEPIEAENEPFDPEKHEAMMREEKEGLDGKIVLDVFENGYMLHDRVLRPASVKVGVPASLDSD